MSVSTSYANTSLNSSLLFFGERVAQSPPKRPTREPMRELTLTLIPNVPPSQFAAELQTCILAGF
jgi:hypothetical protein